MPNTDDVQSMGFEELLSSVASRLVAAQGAEASALLRGCLRDIARYLGVARISLGSFTDDWRPASDTRIWLDPDLHPEGQAAPIHRSMAQLGPYLRDHGSLMLDTRAPSPGLEDDAKVVAERGVRHVLGALLNTPGEQLDCMVVSTFQPHPGWDEQTVRRLRLLGHVVIGAMRRFQAERSAEMQENRYRLLTDNIPGLFSVITPQHRYEYVNIAYARQFGRPQDDIVGCHMAEIIGPLYPQVRDALDRALAGAAQTITVTLRDTEGSPRHLRGQLVPSHDEHGDVEGVLALITDVTDLRDTQEQLRRLTVALRLEHRVVRAFLSDDDDVAYTQALDAILESLDSPLGMLGFIDKDGTMVLPAMTDEARRGARMSLGTVRLPPDQWRGIWGRALRERRTIVSNDVDLLPPEHFPLFSGVAVPIMDAIEPLGVLTLGHKTRRYSPEDVARIERVARVLAPVVKGRMARSAAEAERETMRHQLLQVQKMEAVGRLAGGVAHDFNNILQAIVGYSELSLMTVPEDHPARADIQEVLSAARRARALVRQLLLFSRRGPSRFESVDLLELLHGLSRMLRRVLGDDIRLSIEVDAPSAVVHADGGQLEQVIVNLAVNARDAMPDGGDLRLLLSSTQPDADMLATSPWVRPGRFLCLSVVDSGVGISAEASERMFEPFFTTKEVGKGTGLGLATVYGIVKDHGGVIRARNEPGGGARLDVYLPVTDIPPGRGADESTSPGLGPLGQGTVLVAEDDPRVRAFVVEVLQAAGYTVLQADDGPGAVRVFLQSQARIDLAVLDVVMPGFSGVAGHDRLREIRPDLPVLFISGHDRDLLSGRLTDDQRDGVLQKPFSAHELLRRVRQFLDQGAHIPGATSR